MFSIYDEERIIKQIDFQKKHHWDLDQSFAWNKKIDFERPLVALDKDALLFPGSSSEERLVISQWMGLLIATCIFEMEECLLELKKEAWIQPVSRHPVSQSFEELGELFFLEEEKHSKAFKRYFQKFSNEMGLDENEVFEMMPRIKGTNSEKILKWNLKKSGTAFWWIVAAVEQQFLTIYHSLAPFQNELEPLYFSLHEKHFEEEAKHIHFPFLMIENIHKIPGFHLQIQQKTDLIFSQILTASWATSSLKRILNVKKVATKHYFFKTLSKCLKYMNQISKPEMIWRLFTRTPYVSSLVNPSAQSKVLKFASNNGCIIAPTPMIKKAKLVSIRRKNYA